MYVRITISSQDSMVPRYYNFESVTVHTSLYACGDNITLWYHNTFCITMIPTLIVLLTTTSYAFITFIQIAIHARQVVNYFQHKEPADEREAAPPHSVHVEPAHAPGSGGMHGVAMG